MIRFHDWIKTRESSAFTRWRNDFALGLKPGLPGNINSRSTGSPFEQEKLGKKAKKKKKKSKKKSCHCENYDLTPLTADDFKVTSVDDHAEWFAKYGKNTTKLGEPIGIDDDMDGYTEKAANPDAKVGNFLDKVGVFKGEKEGLEKDADDEMKEIDKKKKDKKDDKSNKRCKPKMR